MIHSGQLDQGIKCKNYPTIINKAPSLKPPITISFPPPAYFRRDFG